MRTEQTAPPARASSSTFVGIDQMIVVFVERMTSDGYDL